MATNVIISSHPIKTSERIDKFGNVISAQTKQIIQPREPEYVPPVVAQTPTEPQPPIEQPVISSVSPMNQIDPMSIQEQIDQVKKNLKKLKELKKLKIKENKLLNN